MADGPDLAINQNSKTRVSGKTSETASSGGSVPIVRLTSGADVPTVKFTPTVPIQILRVEDKSMSHHHQLTDAHGRPMGVATPVPVNSSSGGGSGVVGGGGGGGGSTRKKTGSSFQITSVTDGSRLSNDGGDDSADDLDESHTDDLSSEMGVDISKTDYDYSSEDAFSSIRDDQALIHQYSQQQQQQQQPPALINSSGQKISLFTHNENSGEHATTNVDSTPSNVSVTVVESPATVPMSVVQNPEIQWHNRFRVVKIESSEPFRRGRWLCMDFLDPPPPSLPHGETGDKDSNTVSGISSGGGNGSDNSSGPNSLHHGDSVVIEHGSGAPTIITSSWSIDPNAQFGTAGGVSLPLNAGSVVNQLSHMGVNCDHYPVSIILQTQQQGNLDFTNTALHMQGRTPQPQYVQQHPGFNVPASTNNAEYTNTSNVPSISNTANVTQDYPPLQSQQQQQQQQSGNILDYAHSLSTTSQVDVHVVSSSQGPISGDSAQQPAVIAAQSLTQPPLLYSNPPVSNNEYSQQQQNVQTNAIISGQQQQQQQQQQAQQSQCYIQQVVPPIAGSVPIQETMNQTEMVNAISAVSSASSTAGISVSAQTGGTTAASTNAQSTTPGNVVSPSQETVEGGQQVVQQSGEEGETESLKALAAFLGEGHKLTGSAMTSRALSPVDDYVAFTSGKYSSSGTSTVAIDNKIEQAMDLVKSHLMFAVREEVDVLKEKITELMERINQLEFENSILKAAASPETLALLANSQTPNPPST